MTRRVLLMSLCAMAIGICSCGKSDGRKPTFAVTGKVVDAAGKPLPNAAVVFHPVGESGPTVVTLAAFITRNGGETITLN